jgi:hypothetical protein
MRILTQLLRGLSDGGVEFLIVGAAKRAAGRPKDLKALLELQALWEAQRPDVQP